MAFTLRQPTVPLRVDETGQVRVAGTRVTLATVVRAFQNGDTPEHILQSYPTLDLASIYGVIAYCLQFPDDVREYLADVERIGEEMRNQSSPWPPELLERIRERRQAPGAGPGK